MGWPAVAYREAIRQTLAWTHIGSLRLSVADGISFVIGRKAHYRTFQMEQDVRLVVFEHLSHKLNIHVLNVDFLDIRLDQDALNIISEQIYLEASVHNADSLVEFLLNLVSEWL